MQFPYRMIQYNGLYILVTPIHQNFEYKSVSKYKSGEYHKIQRLWISIFVATLFYRASKLALSINIDQLDGKMFLYSGCITYAKTFMTISWMTSSSGSVICLRNLRYHCARTSLEVAISEEFICLRSHYNLKKPSAGYK